MAASKAGIASTPDASAHIDLREGKASLSRELAEILDRLQTSAELWPARLDGQRTGRPQDRYFAATRARLRKLGTRLMSGDLNPARRMSRRRPVPPSKRPRNRHDRQTGRRP